MVVIDVAGGIGVGGVTGAVSRECVMSEMMVCVGSCGVSKTRERSQKGVLRDCHMVCEQRAEI